LSAHAILSPDELIISGVSGDLFGWPSRLLELQRSIPSNVTLRTDMLTISSDFRLAESCGQAVDHFSAGPISFEKSSAEFRSSAYPVLDRIIAITTACRNSEISVTGHTDTSGNESLNLQLSLKRARAVAAYIERGGIAASRMIVAGAGSSEPIADNETKYGRGLNRRIDVVLSSAQP
jgi:OOP family OmpA-OmpF porin